METRTLLLTLALAAAILAPPAGLTVSAQEPSRPPRAARPAAPAKPAPRWPDGRINFGPPPGETGVWERKNQYLAINPKAYEARATRSSRIDIAQVPLQPWARALTDYRQSLALSTEPYTRCKPAGGPRQFMSPYGLEIVDIPDLKQVFIFNISDSMSYRRIYMDGRQHPAHVEPSYFGHSIGHWDGDTLVIDTVGYNENFWMNRDGMPHTEQLHTIERIRRPDFDTLDYTVTIDDPGAYTAPWTSGYTLGWEKGELFEYMCQENNLSPESMEGEHLFSPIAP